MIDGIFFGDDFLIRFHLFQGVDNEGLIGSQQFMGSFNQLLPFCIDMSFCRELVQGM